MKMVFLYSCCRLFGLIPACFLVTQASQANAGEIYAYIDAQGKLLVSPQKSDARYVRFDPARRITPRMVTGKTSWIVPKTMSQSNLRAAWPAKSALNEAYETPPRLAGNSNALRYTPLIDSIAQEIGVSANLLHAVIQVESAYNPVATSAKGAQGLMQLIPATAQRFGVDQSFEPAANVRGGARYLKNLLSLFNNDIQLTLAAYNAGEGAVKKYNNTIPPYPETQAYVRRVQSLFEQRGE